MKTAAKTLADVKPMLPGHWGTAPGQNFIYAHVNRVIPARLGKGANQVAVRDGKGVDTSTNFPLTAGRVMSTRSGDSEPGLPRFLARTAQSE